MTKLGKAIVTLFDATAGLDAVNGVWMNKVPENTTTYPYAVYSELPGAKLKWYLDHSGEGQYPVEFRIYHDNESALRTYQDALHAAFDFAKPAMDSPAYCQGFLRESDSIKVEAVDPKTMKTVYVATSRYKVFVGNP